MKKKILSFLAFICIILLVSCNEGENKSKYYNVSFVVENAIVNTVEVLENTAVAEPIAPTKEGYEFKGWFLEEVKWNFDQVVTSDITLEANFEYIEVIKEYKVSFVVDGKTITSQTVQEGNKATEPVAPTKEDHEFEGWFVGGKKWDFNTPITKNITAIAQFKKVITLMDYYISMEDHLDSSSFKENLHILLKTNAVKLTYSQVWTALEVVDAADDKNIHCLYTGVLIPKTSHDPGSNPGYTVWNREHSWPKSYGFNKQSYAAYTDIHHLFASEKSINTTRSNKNWGYVTNPTKTDQFGNKWDSNYFEIRDEMKGDIARAMFYMVVRYDDPSELDLELVDYLTSTSDKIGYLGSLTVLLQWHEFDPVSDQERARNEAVYSIQKNRNPFVDYPEWVDLLYPGR